MKLDKFIEKYGNITVDEKELKELLGMNKYFMPAKGEDYWFSNHKGEILLANNNFDSYDNLTFKHCDVFKTEEEAEEHAKKQRFLLKMKRDFLDNSDDIDWKNNDQKKYYISYDHLNEEIVVYSCWSQQYAGFYTTNREWLEQYVKEHEEEIKKYYFEVEEKEEED